MKKSIRNFHGQVEEIPGEILKVVTAAPVVLHLPLLNEETRIRDGQIQIRQRGRQCLALNVHEPRPFIVCWHSLQGNTDISFHRRMGGEHGALHAIRRMFECYMEKLS